MVGCVTTRGKGTKTSRLLASGSGDFAGGDRDLSMQVVRTGIVGGELGSARGTPRRGNVA
jgi:hypothetical protein